MKIGYENGRAYFEPENDGEREGLNLITQGLYILTGKLDPIGICETDAPTIEGNNQDHDSFLEKANKVIS